MKSYKKINPAELASESCSAKSYLSEMYISVVGQPYVI